METRALNICQSRPPLEYMDNSEEDEAPVWTHEAKYKLED